MIYNKNSREDIDFIRMGGSKNESLFPIAPVKGAISNDGATQTIENLGTSVTSLEIRKILDRYPQYY